MHLPQAFGQRPIRLAEGGERKHFTHPRAARDVVRGHRLEKASAHILAPDGSVNRLTEKMQDRYLYITHEL